MAIHIADADSFGSIGGGQVDAEHSEASEASCRRRLLKNVQFAVVGMLEIHDVLAPLNRDLWEGLAAKRIHPQEV